MEATDFDARLAGADLVITGEGRIDAQTGVRQDCAGRAPAVPRPPASRASPSAAAWSVDGIEALAAVGAIAVPVTEHPMTDRSGDGRRRPRPSNGAGNGSPAWSG